MKVLVACEFSGIVRDAFIVRGHDAISCDLLPSERPGPHIQGDVLDVIKDGFDLMIAHPPCTYLTNAGVRHLHDSVTSRNGVRASLSGSERWVAMFEAAEFFNHLKNAPIGRIAIENPIPHKYACALIGKKNQVIQPWEFGHGETKATCLWLKRLPPLVPTHLVCGREHRIHKMPGNKNRSHERSRTFQGIADAMADQWGNLND